MMQMKYLRVDMPDGSKWDVPVDVIARHRAEYYKDEFDNDIEKSLKEDTLPLFESDEYEIEDWAANNMNWDEVATHAVRINKPDEPDYQEGWVNGEKEVVDVDTADVE
jgi:hypothetical protein